jgi:hypothetical protein
MAIVAGGLPVDDLLPVGHLPTISAITLFLPMLWAGRVDFAARSDEVDLRYLEVGRR